MKYYKHHKQPEYYRVYPDGGYDWIWCEPDDSSKLQDINRWRTGRRDYDFFKDCWWKTVEVTKKEVDIALFVASL